MADTQEYVIPEPTTAEIDDLAAKLAVVDPDGGGIPMNRLRVFYPKLGWGFLQKRLEALRAQGRVTSDLRNTGGAVSFEYWTLTPPG